MTWFEVALILVALAGIFAGAILVAQRPSFWYGLGAEAIKSALPKIVEIVTKRMPPEQEKAWRDCERRGGKWNHRKRRCE